MNSLILERSLAALRASGAKFIVVLPDGTTHSTGDLRLEQPKPEKGKRRRRSQLPQGALSNYYMPYIKDLAPGQIADIPFNEMPIKSLVSGITARACQMWGARSTMVVQNPERKVIEVLRYA